MPAAPRARATRATASSLIGNPPRPPNAWIIYRSEKMKSFPPPGPGDPPRAQAEVSKLISAMWKSEPPETRAMYEAASEMRKAEHAAKYPNYRFQPLKKEDKERIREEKKQEKEQAKLAKHAARRSRTLNATPAPSSAAGTPAPSVSHAPSPSASGRWKPGNDTLAPYFNPQPFDPQPSTPTSSTPLTTPNHASPQTVLSQSTSSSGSEFLDNASASASTSSSGQSPYPPSPEHRSYPSLAAPVPSYTIPLSEGISNDLGLQLQAALSDYQGSATLPENGARHQDIMLNLDPDMVFDSDYWVNQVQQQHQATPSSQQPDGSTTLEVSGDPDHFDLGHYLTDPETFNGPSSFEQQRLDNEYLNFLVPFEPVTSNSLRHPYEPFSASTSSVASNTSLPSFNFSEQSTAASDIGPVAHDHDSPMITPPPPASEPTPTQAEFEATYSPPRGAANVAVRRVAGDWRRSFPSPRVTS